MLSSDLFWWDFDKLWFSDKGKETIKDNSDIETHMGLKLFVHVCILWWTGDMSKVRHKAG